MTTTGRRIRVGFINTHPIQYAAPLYRFINGSDDVEAVPIYLTDQSLRGAVDVQFGREVVWDVDLLGGTDPIFVPGYETRMIESGTFKMAVPGIMKVIRKGQLDALVIFGHVQFANHLATIAAKRMRLPVFYRGETHLGLDGTALKRLLRRTVMGNYYKLLDGFLAIGSLNHKFYRAMGVPERKIFDAPYAVDNQRMIAAADIGDNERAEVRASFGVRSDVPLILYASKLTTRKHPDDLLAAARKLRDEGLEFDLLFVGTGELEERLRARAVDFPGAAPLFGGFINQSELPRVMGAADIFVLPSENEPWGLIINEAMCAGLAIVTTHEVGSVPDLVFDGVNGRLFEAGEIDGLAEALRSLVADPVVARAMGDESRRIIGGWGYAEDLAGIRAALRSRGLLAA